ncbi:hypothetical protein F5887DRAFT_1061787 [Amanita rubescens]|nr:hypothetical protein F5887DRAFT_1061787 [Amanita rubescens]
MPERTRKRKRSLQDSSVDLSKMRMALNYLEALKEELDGIEETEEELRTISEHFTALEDILNGAKKPRVTFSTVSSEDLKKAGVKRNFCAREKTDLTKELTSDAEAQIADLHTRIKDIYAGVNMDVLAILPEMRTAQGDRVQICHPVSGYELWLSGNVDYAVIEYRLLSPGGSREDAFEIANGRLFLVQAKRQNLEQSLISCIPEAVSQAIALLKSAILPEVCFCLSDGQTWIFFILKSENNTLTYYESATRRLSRDVVENTDLPLREIVQLVHEWLRPTVTDLFALK